MTTAYETPEYNEAEYNKLVCELVAIERTTGLYLTDECVDRENVLTDAIKEGDDHFWSEMHFAARTAAGQRAEEAGLSINKLIGRVIY